MNNFKFLAFAFLIVISACSGEDDVMPMEEATLSDIIEGGWILEQVRLEGSGCDAAHGELESIYMADSLGCVSINEIFGSTRCINLDLDAIGGGLFLWSEIVGGEDALITYEINEDDEFSYCFVDSFCSGDFALVGDKLENNVDTTFDPDVPCFAVFVLRKK